MGLGRLLEACRVHRKVALERSSKPTKYELQGPYGDPVYELAGTRSERNNYLGTSGMNSVAPESNIRFSAGIHWHYLGPNY